MRKVFRLCNTDVIGSIGLASSYTSSTMAPSFTSCSNISNHSLPTLISQSRSFSDFNSNDDYNEKNLTNMPNYVWPNLFKSFKNLLYGNIFLTSLDKKFDIAEFYRGSLQAVEVVSRHLSHGEFDKLKGLVTDDVIHEVQMNMRNFRHIDRVELNISKEDVYIRFPYEIGILQDEGKDDVEGNHVEITMVYHVMKNYRNLGEIAVTPMSIVSTPGFENRIRILNYRFIRRFSNDSSGDWIINALNHFKPSSLKHYYK